MAQPARTPDDQSPTAGSHEPHPDGLVQRIESAVRHETVRYQQHWTVRLVRTYLDDDADGLAPMIAFAAMFSLMQIHRNPPTPVTHSAKIRIRR